MLDLFECLTATRSNVTGFNGSKPFDLSSGKEFAYNSGISPLKLVFVLMGLYSKSPFDRVCPPTLIEDPCRNKDVAPEFPICAILFKYPKISFLFALFSEELFSSELFSSELVSSEPELK